MLEVAQKGLVKIAKKIDKTKHRKINNGKTEKIGLKWLHSLFHRFIQDHSCGN